MSSAYKKLKIKEKYCNISINEDGKKLVNFGVTWGALPKGKANASFVQTGNGFYVIDIDFKNIKKAPKNIQHFVTSLGAPTVETARGYHFVIKSDAPVSNHQNIFDNKKFGVDIRGEGGLIFTSYWGNEKGISYTKTGKILKDKDYSIFKSLPEDVREPKRNRSEIDRGDIGELTKQKIKRLLKKVDIKEYRDRDDWLSMIASIYHGGGEDVKKVARKWSMGDKEQYDEWAFDNVWWQVTTGRFGSEYSVGTLKKAAGDVRPPEDTFRDMTEEIKARKKELSKKEKKQKAEFDVTSTGLGLTQEKSEEIKNQKHLVSGVVVDGMHTVLYGKAGSNKTSIIGWMMVNMLKENKDKRVQMWEFDASNNHVAAMFQHIQDGGVNDSFELIIGETAKTFYDFYDQAIKFECDMSKLVIVIDTLKFVAGDVNSKASMQKYFHYIKQIQSLGATIITLAHANKDGVAASGTAELEQDSDALLRIDREVNDGFDSGVTTTIKAGGRVRFSCEGMVYKSMPTGSDYEYLYSSLTTMRLTTDTIADVEAEDKKEEQISVPTGEMQVINEMKAVIDSLNDRKKTTALQNLIEIEMRSSGQEPKQTQKLLLKYSGTFWEFSVKKAKRSGKRIKTYVTT